MTDPNLIFNEKLIASRLLSFNSPERLVLQGKSFFPSAILFLIIYHDTKPYELVLIRRTERKSDKHSGEMSFPGGKFDPRYDKSLKDTALRELKEELGIPMSDVDILGSFDDHLTPKHFIITPFVGAISEEQQMIKQNSEVQEVVKIPVDFFTDPHNYKERTYYLRDELIAVGKYRYVAPDGKKYVIFGATTHLIVHYIQHVHHIQLMAPGSRRLNCKDFELREK